MTAQTHKRNRGRLSREADQICQDLATLASTAERAHDLITRRHLIASNAPLKSIYDRLPEIKRRVDALYLFVRRNHPPLPPKDRHKSKETNEKASIPCADLDAGVTDRNGGFVLPKERFSGRKAGME